MLLKREIYQEILPSCRPGPNKDAAKADLLQSFQIPARFTEDYSSSSDRLVNIFAAWVSDEYVWALVDFARIVRFHVMSRDAIWQKSELTPNSKVCDYIFNS